MSSSKYTKLGITIFTAIVCAGIVLTLVQRWMYASNLEKAQAHYIKMQEQAAAKSLEYSTNLKAQHLKQVEAQVMGNNQLISYQERTKKWKAEEERKKRQREFNKERKKDHYAYMNDNTEKVKTERELRKEKREQERLRQKAKDKQEYERKKSSRRTNQETCKFWREQYKEIKSDYNKNHMEAACKRASSY